MNSKNKKVNQSIETNIHLTKNKNNYLNKTISEFSSKTSI